MQATRAVLTDPAAAVVELGGSEVWRRCWRRQRRGVEQGGVWVEQADVWRQAVVRQRQAAADVTLQDVFRQRHLTAERLAAQATWVGPQFAGVSLAGHQVFAEVRLSAKAFVARVALEGDVAGGGAGVGGGRRGREAAGIAGRDPGAGLGVRPAGRRRLAGGGTAGRRGRHARLVPAAVRGEVGGAVEHLIALGALVLDVHDS